MPPARDEVGWLDQAGRGEEADDLLRRFAEAGDIYAMYALAKRLDPADRGEEAEQWLRRAIEIGGDPTALNFLAEQLDRTDRPEKQSAYGAMASSQAVLPRTPGVRRR